MRLSEALTIGKNDVACFVGAGGKTSATMIAAREFTSEGTRSLLTTTTKYFEPIPREGEILLLSEDMASAAEQLRALFLCHGCVILGVRRRGEIFNTRRQEPDYPVKVLPYKLDGVPPEWVDHFARRNIADVVLIEGDGAGHRMIKAPDNHEPVVPKSTTILIPMADVECLGKPLTDEFVHRPTLLADLADVPLGIPISPEIVAIALVHPDSNLKTLPAGARVVPLLTLRDPERIVPNAEKVARLLLLCPYVQHVVLAHLRSDPIRVKVIRQ